MRAITRENLAFLGVAVAGIIGLFIIGLFKPHLIAEDGLVENLSAIGFAAAGLLALGVAFGKRALLTLWEKGALLGTSAFCLLLFLSEISFGARIFDIQMPQMRGGGEFDGGHDMIIVVVRYLRDAGSTGMLMAAIGAVLLAAAAAAVLVVFRQQAQVVIKRIVSSSFEFRLAFALAMLAGAEALDLISSREVAVLEEVLEFSASIALILAVYALLRQKGGRKGFGNIKKEGYVAGAAAPGEPLNL